MQMELTLQELKRISGKEGVPQATIEKDYALSIALKIIAESSLANNLVFKGGTAIKKIYFEEMRYSEDLDFNAHEITKEEIFKTLEQLLAKKQFGGLFFQEVEEEKTGAGLKANAKFTGPLNHPQRIRFDFNFRDNTIDAPAKKEIIDYYSLGAHSIFTISLEEVLAEKMQALYTRSAARDLYDLWFLAKNNVKKDDELIKKKFAYYNEKPDRQKILENIKKMSGSWNNELSRLVNNLPAYERIADELVRFI